MLQTSGYTSTVTTRFYYIKKGPIHCTRVLRTTSFQYNHTCRMLVRNSKQSNVRNA